MVSKHWRPCFQTRARIGEVVGDDFGLGAGWVVVVALVAGQGVAALIFAQHAAQLSPDHPETPSREQAHVASIPGWPWLRDTCR